MHWRSRSLWHQGTTFVHDAPLIHARPVLLDEIARRFPTLKMWIAHLGHPWCDELISVIHKHPNLYADMSALTPRPLQFYFGMAERRRIRRGPQGLLRDRLSVHDGGVVAGRAARDQSGGRRDRVLPHPRGSHRGHHPIAEARRNLEGRYAKAVERYNGDGANDRRRPCVTWEGSRQ